MKQIREGRPLIIRKPVLGGNCNYWPPYHNYIGSDSEARELVKNEILTEVLNSNHSL